MDSGRVRTGARAGGAVVLVLLMLVLAAAGSSLTGCGGRDTTTSGPPVITESSSTVPTAPTTVTSTTSRASTTSTTAVSLTERQRAGQRVIYSYPGPAPPAELLAIVKRGETAGIIFFGENIRSVEQVRGVIRQFEEAAADPGNPIKAPLLFMTDQEGGRIRRLPGEPVQSQKQIGASADPVGAAAAAGAAAASTLLSAGMNVNLAPVLDVYRETGDFSDRFERSYSSDPAVAAELAAAFIEAQQRAGVAATAKHFPGLGAAARGQNTDEQPVILDVPAAVLRDTDMRPYPAAFAAGVRLVMLDWAVYPALDPDSPAGMSPAVIREELRQRLGFQGVTITDALEAGALKSFGSTGERAGLAAAAGMDLILCSARDVSQGVAATEALMALRSGDPAEAAAFDAAVQRVLELRTGLRD